MQNRPYKFSFLSRHRTIDIFNKYSHQLDEHQQTKYVQQLGQFLTEFKVQDRYSQWTVLKTEAQISKFALGSIWHHLFYKKNNKTLETDQWLKHFEQQINKSDSEKIPDHIRKFFEIYITNIIKITSCLMQKKVRGLTRLKRIQNFFLGAQWQHKRIIVTKMGIIQTDDHGNVTNFLKFDQFFTILSGQQATGIQFGVALYSAQRKIVLKAKNLKDFIIFMSYTNAALQKYVKKIYYLSSSPNCKDNDIQYFIDAEGYYESVAHQIEAAQNTIYICGWWISPQLYLIRSKDKLLQQYRLDNLLLRKAKNNVKIYILIFLSPSMIPNDSMYTKKKLSELHENIIVQRHPHQFLPKLWSHHEKLVIIDHKIAFMGGLDLCYGRYDSSNHPISSNSNNLYPGIDYNNVRIRDFIQVGNFTQDLQDRNLPRLPWHDIAFKAIGGIVSDLQNHFVQYWNFAILQKQMAPFVTKNKQKIKQVSRETIHGISQWQKNLIDAIIKLAISKRSDLTQRQKQLMRSFIKNKNQGDKMKSFLENLHDKFEISNGPGENCLVLSIENLKLLKREFINYNKLQKASSNDTLQLLRSASQWSIGLENGVTQRSIQNAYLSIIRNSQNFIYIQNQFFISGTGEKDSFVENQIANALYQRIKKAIQKNEKFRVVVFMPLIPGMQGPLNQQCPLGLKLTMFWQYNTISQSEFSLIERIKMLTNHYQDYIQFFSLRKHGMLDNEPVTQIIYIHSKLIIVDDHIVLCGSANINDRSQAGFRDSELAVLFSKGQTTVKKMNGIPYQINKKAHSLRSRLYQQHFDLSEHEAQDPLSVYNVQLTRNIAEQNTITYRQIFGCVPDDNVKKFQQVNTFQKIIKIQNYMNNKHKFRGHAVHFPTKFLQNQKLYSFDVDKIQDIFT